MCVEARWRSSSLSGLSRGVCVVCTWLALALSLLLSLSCSFCTCSSGFSRALSHTHFHTHCRSVTLAFLLLALKQVARLSCQFFVNRSSFPPHTIIHRPPHSASSPALALLHSSQQQSWTRRALYLDLTPSPEASLHLAFSAAYARHATPPSNPDLH